MNPHNAILPYWLAHHLQGGPVFNTQILQTTAGYEFRKSERSQVLYRYKAQNCYLTKQQYDEIVGFFNSRQGKALCFRLKDFFDYTVTDQIIGIGDDSQQEFMLYKQYLGSHNDYCRHNLIPIKESIILTINDIATAADIDITNKKITLPYPLKISETLKISFEFDIKVRFDNDDLNFRISEDGCIMLDEINLVEVV